MSARTPARLKAERSYYERNKEAVKARATRWVALNPRRRLAVVLKRRFGLSLDQYDALLDRQRGLCAICSGRFDDHLPHVDHHHASGHVRGLLCGRCNRAVGLLRDRSDFAYAAAHYLDGVAQFVVPEFVAVAPRTRAQPKKGASDGRAKLSPADVRAIRRLASEGTPQRKLAERFHVSVSQISNVVHRLAWPNLR